MRRAHILIVLTAVLALDAAATTSRPIDVACPIDGTKVAALQIGSSNNFGGSDRDLLSRSLGGQPFMMGATTCPKCLYSGYAEDFDRPDHPARISAEIRAAVAGGKLALPPDAPARRDSLPAWVRLDLIAQLATLAGKPALERGDTVLRAAWAVRLEDNPFVEVRELPREEAASETEEERTARMKDPSAFEIARAKKLLAELPATPADLKKRRALEAAWLLHNHGEHDALLAALPTIGAVWGDAAAWKTTEAPVRASIARERRYQKEARDLFDQGLAQAKDDRDVYAYLGAELTRRLGEPASARARFEAVIAQKPRDWIERLAREQLALLEPPAAEAKVPPAPRP